MRRDEREEMQSSGDGEKRKDLLLRGGLILMQLTSDQERKIERRPEKRQGGGVKKTGRHSLPVGVHGGLNGESYLESDIDDGMKEPSNMPSQATVEDILDSMNLIDESSRHLYALMKGMRGSEVTEVQAACKTAKAITDLMRIKLDVIKFQEKILRRK